MDNKSLYEKSSILRSIATKIDDILDDLSVLTTRISDIEKRLDQIDSGEEKS